MTRRTALLAAVIAVVACIPFLPIMQTPFVSDDWDFLYRVLTSQSTAVADIFTSNVVGGHGGGSYRPLTSLFWVTMTRAFGMNPLPFHLVSILFHAATAVLLFLIGSSLRFFGDRREIVGFGAGLLFALMPNHAAISWISVINDTMMAAFLLLSLYALLQWQQQREHRWAWYGLSLIALLASLLTKEMGIVFPVIGTLLLFLERDRTGNVFKAAGRSVAACVPHGLIVLFFFAIRHLSIGLLVGDYTGQSFYLDRFFVARSIISMTVSNLFSGRVRTEVTVFLFDTVWTWLPLLMLGIGLLVWLWRERKELSQLSILFIVYLASLIPVVRFAVNALRTYPNSEGERLVYLPSAFFALWFVGSVVVCIKRKQTALLVVMAIAISLFVQLQPKVTRWQRAGELGESLVQQAVNEIEQNNIDGVVFVGMPDMIHGAFVFRNAFPLAVALQSEGSIRPEQLLVTKPRTVLSEMNQFLVQKSEDTGFLYRSASDTSFIVSEAKEATGDYSYQLDNRSREVWSISYATFGTALEVTMSESFAIMNQEKRIGYFFFDGMNWEVRYE